jgi:hypothetical protein
MAALTQRRNNPQLGVGEVIFSNIDVPLKANAKVFQGGLVALSGGLGVAASTAVGLIAAGVAHLEPATDNSDNTGGADSAITIRVAQGVFKFNNSAAADAIATADRGRLAYIVDDQTVAKTFGAGTRSVAGVIVDVDSSGVYVYVGIQGVAWKEFNLGAPPTVSAAGAIPVGAKFVLLSVDATKAYTLADGLYIGQEITVCVVAGTNTPVGTVTPATKLAGAGIVAALGAVGDFATWVWQGTAGWVVVASQGVTIS